MICGLEILHVKLILFVIIMLQILYYFLQNNGKNIINHGDSH